MESAGNGEGEKEKSCGIVTFRVRGNIREYLFLERSQGFLDFTKGHIEKGETELEAAIRETKEECGLNPQIVDGFREVMNYRYRRSGTSNDKEVVMFLGEVDPGLQVKISHEHVGHVWLTYEKAMSSLTFKNQRDLLEKAESFLNSTKYNHNNKKH
jgi:NUDIX domain.